VNDLRDLDRDQAISIALIYIACVLYKGPNYVHTCVLNSSKNFWVGYKIILGELINTILDNVSVGSTTVMMIAFIITLGEIM